MKQAVKHDVRVIPTFIYYENGHEVRRRKGAMKLGRIEAFCRGL